MLVASVLNPKEHGTAHVDYDSISSPVIVILFLFIHTFHLVDIIRSSQELKIPLFYVYERRMPVTVSATITQNCRFAGGF